MKVAQDTVADMSKLVLEHFSESFKQWFIDIWCSAY